ncbi:Uncharacterised protein [Serratia rubidaea]|uniref:Uncharacterized protein n=1 Tax=Serratia rubidaea TaxID=61652 RepID=A0A4U9HDA9_SERRU|nr:Uncharacterised protein [Serratia rubidaea]
MVVMPETPSNMASTRLMFRVSSSHSGRALMMENSSQNSTMIKKPSWVRSCTFDWRLLNQPRPPTDAAITSV